MAWDEKPDESETERMRRAGRNTWAWSGLSFWVVENTLDLGSLDPVVEAVQPEFGLIEIRRRVAGPAAGGLVPEAALVAVFTVIAFSFLQELGKDAYQAFRSALFAAYRKAKTLANQRGYAPLAIEIVYVEEQRREEKDGEEYEVPEPNLYFVFQPGMDAAKFERAVQELLKVFPEVDRSTQGYYVVMKFDPVSGSWVEDYRE